jgi:hypothetical protein
MIFQKEVVHLFLFFWGANFVMWNVAMMIYLIKLDFHFCIFRSMFQDVDLTLLPS